MDTDQITNTVMVLALGFMVIAGILVGASSLQNTQLACPTGTTLNSTYANCYNSSNEVEAEKGIIYKASTNITKNTMGLTNAMGAQLGTVGTMFGVALILGAIGLIGLGIGVGARMMNK
jgi:hypothetical protein